ncbi:MAG: anti-sigma factor [Cyclobacteriaceae bacterium]|nr:anti-sigma factor [Cyclobacteriaceae bacterium HetDA_MAG_MS6]
MKPSDIHEYIESGILEEFAMGLLSPEEAQSVQKIAKRYPEVQKEIGLIQQTLNILHQQSAVTPRAHLSDLIKSKLITSGSRALDSHQTKNWIDRYLMIAASFTTLVAVLTSIFLYKQLSVAQDNITNLNQEKQEISRYYTSLTTRLQGELRTVNDIQFRQTRLTGLPQHSSAYVFLYVSEQEIYLFNSNLPVPPPGKQYQLWGLVDGRPLNAGLLTSKPDQVSLLKMIAIRNASAYAITLEPLGGSATPTLDQMIVYGQNIEI